MYLNFKLRWKRERTSISIWFLWFLCSLAFLCDPPYFWLSMQYIYIHEASFRLSFYISLPNTCIFYIQCAVWHMLCYPDQLTNFFLLFFAFLSAHRHIGETNMNVYSSRSHTIFRMVTSVLSDVNFFSFCFFRCLCLPLCPINTLCLIDNWE